MNDICFPIFYCKYHKNPGANIDGLECYKDEPLIPFLYYIMEATVELSEMCKY